MRDYKNISGHFSIGGRTYAFKSMFERHWACTLELCKRYPQLSAAILDHEVVSWEYQPEALPFDDVDRYDAKDQVPRLRGILQYRLDFKVTRPDHSFIYHETKGYMGGPDATKLRQFHKYYPGRQVLVVIDGMPAGRTIKSAAARRRYDFLAKLGYGILDAKPIFKSLAGWLEKIGFCFVQSANAQTQAERESPNE